jgi:hypothetical protein
VATVLLLLLLLLLLKRGCRLLLMPYQHPWL